MIYPKLRWSRVAFVIGAIIIAGVIAYPRLIGFSSDVPTYGELKASCDDFLSKSPRADALDAWMRTNQIVPQYRRTPLEQSFKDILVYNGLQTENVNKAATCTYFETRRVQGRFLSSHAVYGYFIFDADGALIEYSMHDIYYGM